MTISQPALRDGEVRADHADPRAPVQGPPTIGMTVLAPLTWTELRCLASRMDVAQWDRSALLEAAGCADDALRADLDALDADTSAVWADAHAASPAARTAEYARMTGSLGGAR